MRQYLVVATVVFAVGCGGTVASSGDASPEGGTETGSLDTGLVDTGSGDLALDTPTGATACRAPTDCVLTSVTCCGVCGAPTEKDLLALHRSELTGYRDKVCADPVACPRCPTALEPNLVADCRASKCVVVDLRKDPITACTKDSECRVRTSACCECGGGFPYLAVSTSKGGDYEKLVCPIDTACAECFPEPPFDVRAVCDPKTKHCALTSM